MTIEPAFHTGRPDGAAAATGSRQTGDDGLEFGVIGNYAGGKWVHPESAQLLDVVNPATAKVHARVVMSGGADVAQVVDEAQAAYQGWRRGPAP